MRAVRSLLIADHSRRVRTASPARPRVSRGLPLHTAWAVDLPCTRSGITLTEFIRCAGGLFLGPPPAVRLLLSVRFFVGGLFGWDRAAPGSVSESFAQRLTDDTCVVLIVVLVPIALIPLSGSLSVPLTATSRDANHRSSKDRPCSSHADSLV
jgi:Protein of unknown function (DUF2867)